jgi:CDP-6-deoxy-D-xylo-4-hexulose-3-dehydrase
MSGALGLEQIKKLPTLIDGRRDNAKIIQKKLRNHPIFFLQEEIGESSWFGFSLVLRPNNKISRKKLISELNLIGFEVRPIVAGNFINNPVMAHIPHKVHGKLENADYIDKNGLFIGNHHYKIDEAIDALAQIQF